MARALGYSIFTEADTWEELKEAVRDAVQCHFDEGGQPDLIRLQPSPLPLAPSPLPNLGEERGKEPDS